MGLSVSLDTGITGLRAAQYAMDVAAHNVANANTDGYSRQDVQLAAVPPPFTQFSGPGNPISQIGLGVRLQQVRRDRDQLLDTQYRDIRGLNDQYQAQASALQEAENTLNEPGDQGIGAQITNFFNAFRDLTSQPESLAARSAAVQSGATLAAAFNRESTLLTQQRTALDQSLDVDVSNVNSMAQQIAALNVQIQQAVVAGGTANDLMDQRDLLLDNLAGMVGASSQAGANGAVDVIVGGHKLVDSTKPFDPSNPAAPGGAVDPLQRTNTPPLTNGFNTITWRSDGSAAGIATGTVKGTIDARDINVSGLLTDLNTLAGGFISAINTAHAAGYGLDNSTGLNFFTGTDAATIGVNQTLVTSPEKLATSDQPNAPGNPNAANAIIAVQSALLFNGGTASVNDSYNSIVSGLGVNAAQAQNLATNQQTLLQHIDTARQSVMGVSIDEEMTNMMKAQHSYEAAARVITASDSMLDTLINHMLV